MSLLETLQLRAGMRASVRTYFAKQGVMEVDVPVLAYAGVTDPNIECYTVRSPVNMNEQFYLLPSPEFYLKRLLVDGSGPVYAFGHAFRAGERGARHQPEFSMLEWYRPGWTLPELMAEVESLVQLFVSMPVRKISYRDLFMDVLSVDPFNVSVQELQILARTLSPAFESEDRRVWLDLLFSHCIEPTLEGMVFVDGFPAWQAALAQVSLDAHGQAVALRFELYVNGVELANAYLEETDPEHLTSRFEADLQLRRERQQVLLEPDHAFIASMRQGMPPSVGVALGFDRLVMLAAGKLSLQSVMPFAL